MEGQTDRREVGKEVRERVEGWRKERWGERTDGRNAGNGETAGRRGG